MAHSKGGAAQPLALVSVFGKVVEAKPEARKQRKAALPPFSLRLTPEERSRLDREAGIVPLGAYIRSRLFEGPDAIRPSRPRNTIKDHQALARLLGELGQSRIANNLNQLAKAANSGSFLLTPEGEASLKSACEAVQAMRGDLMAALGLDGGQKTGKRP